MKRKAHKLTMAHSHTHTQTHTPIESQLCKTHLLIFRQLTQKERNSRSAAIERQEKKNCKTHQNDIKQLSNELPDMTNSLFSTDRQSPSDSMES